ncbi:MAG: hypothetical protein FJW92_03180, partial [Actinobacteria bacterium]|nr:hypothetical protein [Actinomycetota bacterium]
MAHHEGVPLRGVRLHGARQEGRPLRAGVVPRAHHGHARAVECRTGGGAAHPRQRCPCREHHQPAPRPEELLRHGGRMGNGVVMSLRLRPASPAPGRRARTCVLLAGGLVIAAMAAAIPAAAAAAPSTAQLAGQRITWPVDGTTVSPSMRAAIARGEVGSVILFSRNAPNRAVLGRLTRQLQAIPRPAGLDAPLLVTVDQEGGLVKRMAWAPPTMSAARMGARLDAAGIRAE